jgi:hypothetical protein
VGHDADRFRSSGRRVPPVATRSGQASEGANAGDPILVRLHLGFVLGDALRKLGLVKRDPAIAHKHPGLAY